MFLTQTAELKAADMLIVPPNTDHHVTHHEGGVQMQLTWSVLLWPRPTILFASVTQMSPARSGGRLELADEQIWLVRLGPPKSSAC
jgi:hypothetical protein